MIKIPLNDSNLMEMLAIVEACRSHHKFQAELAWNLQTLSEALSSCRSIGVFVKQNLIAFVLYQELGGVLPPDAVEIWCLATHPAAQGQGAMTSLLDQLKMAAPQIWLEVHEHNQVALRFYKNKGFQEVGCRKKYYEDGGNALLLNWKT